MRLFSNPAPGLGVIVPGSWSVPQNPITAARYTPRIGEIMAARFTVPQNPITDALAKGNIGRPDTGPGAAFRRLHGLSGRNGRNGMGCASCGGTCGGTCSGTCNGTCSGGMGGLGFLGIDTNELGDSIGPVWDQVSSVKVAGIPVVYMAAAFMAYQFFFSQPVKSRAPSRYQRVRKTIAQAAA